jgi:hypothetical protein
MIDFVIVAMLFVVATACKPSSGVMFPRTGVSSCDKIERSVRGFSFLFAGVPVPVKDPKKSGVNCRVETLLIVLKPSRANQRTGGIMSNPNYYFLHSEIKLPLLYVNPPESPMDDICHSSTYTYSYLTICIKHKCKRNL